MGEPPPRTGRIPGLDAWRAGLMLAGLLVHADQFQERRALFGAVGFVSAHFRMGLFMVISGLLAGMATAERAGMGRWAARRAVRMALPAATGLAVTGAAFALLGAAGGPFALYHLWFLVALLLYLPPALAFVALDRRFDLVVRLERSARSAAGLQLRLLGGAALLSALLMGTVTAASLRWGEGPERAVLIAGYLPMYLLGLLLGRAPRLLRLLVSDVRGPAAALAGVLLIELAASRVSGAPEGPAVVALTLGLAACPVLAAALALRSALRIERVGPLVRRLSDASMTMYLVHFPILAGLGAGFARLGWNPYAAYAASVPLGGALAYAFHQGAVRRSPTMAALFCGRFPAARRQLAECAVAAG